MTEFYNGLKRQMEEIVGVTNIFLDEPMKDHTSFRAGGAARLLVMPESAAGLAGVMRLLKNESVPFYIMGNGTNLLVRDSGFDGVVVKICDKMSRIELRDGDIYAEAGALLSGVARFALQQELAGLEFAEGIPGTVGGAVAMNAGAYGGEIKDTLLSAAVMDDGGEMLTLNSKELELGYRSSAIGKRGLICVYAVFRLEKGDRDAIKRKMDENRRLRTEKQPLDKPSAGSTFKRPEGYFAGKLISDSGLKGYRMGGAAVSDKHAGFVINEGNASSDDIIGLIEHIKRTVYKKYGVSLEPEVKIIGG